jgi:protein gp37
MNRTKIEWCDYTVNPVKGKCPMACPYCYARRMYDRFHWNPDLRFEPNLMLDVARLSESSRVFVGSTMELFHDTVPQEWTAKILSLASRAPWLTYVFLTKCPHNLAQHSPFPKNVWVGVSMTKSGQYGAGISILMENIKAVVKFLSLEPLLGRIPGSIPWWCNWVIIGQQTPVSEKTQPKVEWLKEIVDAADKAGIRVFLKNNLLPLFEVGKLRHDIPLWAQGKNLKYGDFRLRQEMPETDVPIRM